MTETTQPDPQVVAWMRGYLREHPGAEPGGVIVAARTALGYESFAPELFAAYEAARRPLTVADIPAGQGPASLHLIGPSRSLMYRHESGTTEAVLAGIYATDPAQAALADHLAATLPHVTSEEPR